MRVARSTSSPERDADLALCQRVAKGDRAAAETLARLIMPVVRHAALRVTRTASDAEDAAQVATLEVLRSAKHFAARGSLKGWAGRIAVRSVVRWNARHGTPMVHEHDPDRSLGAPAPTSGFEALPRPLQHYLDALPEPQRTALVLRHSLGYTIPEIAEATESPVPTVRSRIDKAMTRVRSAIRRDVQLGTKGASA